MVRSAMGGFFLLGALMALLGASLPVWMNYFHFDMATAGNYFLAFNLGIFTAAMVSRRMLGKLGLRGILVMACGLTAASLLVVTGISSPLWILPPLLVLGFATGMLTSGVSWLMFDAPSGAFASTSNRIDLQARWASTARYSPPAPRSARRSEDCCSSLEIGPGFST